MKKHIIALTLFFAITLPSCDTLRQAADDYLNEPTLVEIGQGLKQALEFGISEGSKVLSARDGYYKSVYKILLPEEARIVTERLKVIPGFTNLEDIILEKLNRAAEDAAKSAAPIFVDAIKAMTFDDAVNILMGADDAATQYLHVKTFDPLYQEFNPVIVTSLNKFNAIQYWADAVNAYNKIPFVSKVNPKLDEYVTEKALEGLFDMVAKKELGIRNDISQRTTDLLKKVFAKQDRK
ncbi:MAG TPA: DUF4197 domain-containing protein [Saprospiraceae bacterium]|nr:DUF4197 domain-containing protein [Saprospiraceae bacterium]